MCFSANNFLSLLLTLSWRFFGIRLTFWCLGWKFSWHLDLASWFSDLPMRKIRLGIVSAMSSLNSEDDEMVSTWLPENEDDCVTASPNWSNKSRSISDLRPSATIVNVAEREIHPLLKTRACTLASLRIGSFKRVLNCGVALLCTQNACELLFTTCDARDWLRMLLAFPESTNRVVEILPILIGMFRGYNFPILFCMRTTILSCPLL